MRFAGIHLPARALRLISEFATGLRVVTATATVDSRHSELSVELRRVSVNGFGRVQHRSLRARGFSLPADMPLLNAIAIQTGELSRALFAFRDSADARTFVCMDVTASPPEQIQLWSDSAKAVFRAMFEDGSVAVLGGSAVVLRQSWRCACACRFAHHSLHWLDLTRFVVTRSLDIHMIEALHNSTCCPRVFLLPEDPLHVYVVADDVSGSMHALRLCQATGAVISYVEFSVWYATQLYPLGTEHWLCVPELSSHAPRLVGSDDLVLNDPTGFFACSDATLTAWPRGQGFFVMRTERFLLYGRSGYEAKYALVHVDVVCCPPRCDVLCVEVSALGNAPCRVMVQEHAVVCAAAGRAKSEVVMVDTAAQRFSVFVVDAWVLCANKVRDPGFGVVCEQIARQQERRRR
jgi:hypothetical protein